MQQLVDKLRGELEGFTNQREDLVLLVRCTASDAAITLKLLSDLEDQNASDLFLMFSPAFRDEASFVTELVAKLREQHAAACAAQEADGQPPLPPLPDLHVDDDHSPKEVLLAAIAYARGLLPSQGGHLLIWAMVPMEIADPVGFRRFWRTLAPLGGVEPWMRGVRLLVREDVAEELEPDLAMIPRVRQCRPDFGPAAMAGALEREAANPERPEPQRMQALLQLAFLDSAHGRTTEAIGKHQVLLDYYKQAGDLSMQALILNGFGDIFRRLGDMQEAQRWYEFAVTPLAAAGADAPPVVFSTVVKNLGDVAYHTGRFGEAEQYYGGWAKLAGALDPESRVRALELQGLSLEQARDLPRAATCWEEATALCRERQMDAYLRQNLGHLQRAYEVQERRGELAQVDLELSELASKES